MKNVKYADGKGRDKSNHMFWECNQVYQMDNDKNIKFVCIIALVFGLNSQSNEKRFYNLDCLGNV